MSESELRYWLRLQAKRYTDKAIDAKWDSLNSNNDKYLTLDEIVNNTFIGYDTCLKHFFEVLIKFKNKKYILGSDEEKAEQKDLYETYMGYLNRDKNRFHAADGDKDGKLNKTGKKNTI